MLTVAMFLFGFITTFFNCRTLHVPPAQVDVSLTLNYPPARLIIGIDMVGVGGVDGAFGDEGAVDEGAVGDEGVVDDGGAIGGEGTVGDEARRQPVKW